MQLNFSYFNAVHIENLVCRFLSVKMSHTFFKLIDLFVVTLFSESNKTKPFQEEI